MTVKCQQLSKLVLPIVFLDFLQQVQDCDQYSGRQSLTPCQHLLRRATSSSVLLSISEAGIMADCPPSVTSRTV